MQLLGLKAIFEYETTHEPHSIQSLMIESKPLQKRPLERGLLFLLVNELVKISEVN